MKYVEQRNEMKKLLPYVDYFIELFFKQYKGCDEDYDMLMAVIGSVNHYLRKMPTEIGDVVVEYIDEVLFPLAACEDTMMDMDDYGRFENQVFIIDNKADATKFLTHYRDVLAKSYAQWKYLYFSLAYPFE